jgi:mono/diheme cytochrome c family protein
VFAVWTAVAVLAVCGCTQHMEDQPRYKPYAKSTFFSDGLSAREPVPGTVARGQLRLDTHLYEGKVDGKLAQTFPEPIDRAMLERGRERFGIFCSPCHDRVGTGGGMVVLRGFPAPPSLHIERLRKAPPGHFFDVMTNGLGRMPSYKSQIPVRDRWAIVAYVRALQLSQHADEGDLTDADRKQLESIDK